MLLDWLVEAWVVHLGNVLAWVWRGGTLSVKERGSRGNPTAGASKRASHEAEREGAGDARDKGGGFMPADLFRLVRDTVSMSSVPCYWPDRRKLAFGRP